MVTSIHKALGCLGTTQVLKSQCWQNYLGEGYYPAGGAVTCPRVMVWAPGPHPLMDMDSSLTFASPVITRSSLTHRQTHSKPPLPSSESTLGCLATRAWFGKSYWGKASSPQSRFHEYRSQNSKFHNNLTLLNKRRTVEHLPPKLLSGTH